jgi:hypothetical protein
VPKVLMSVVGVTALAVSLSSAVSADTPPVTFQAIAAADGFRVSVAAPGLSIVNTLVDVGGPAAQAGVNGLGVSTGYAAYPDPGELVLTGPGLVAGASGGAVSFPPFPMAVQTSWPAAPDDRIGEDPYLVEAHSRAHESTALARSGHGESATGQVEAAARAALDGDVTVAHATSAANAVAIGPLRIGSLVAEATARVVPGQEPELTTAFHVSGIEVDGAPVGLTPAGLVVAGTAIPLPDSDPARAALAEAGIDLQYLTVAAEGSTARSGGLQVTVRQVLSEGVPGAIPAGQVVEYRIVLGQAVATAGATPAVPAPTEAPVELPAAPAIAEPAAHPPAAGSTSPGLVPGAASPPAPAASTLVAGPVAQRALVPDRFDFYWVLVVGAVAAAAALHVNRTAGRRRGWLEGGA